MQAPTSERQDYRKNSTALSKFHRRGEHCSPAQALRYHKAPRVEQSPTPTINRKKMRLNFNAISQFRRRGGAWLRPPLPYQQTSKYSPAPLAGLQCRPLQAKGKIIVKILPPFQNSIVGASIARPSLPQLQPQKYSRAPLRACNAGPYKQKARLMQKFYRHFIIPPAFAAPAAPQKSPTHPVAPPAPHPNPHFAPQNENSLKNLPHAVNKLTLVSVTFHPRAFIINLSKHCLPRVQNGAAAWF